MHTRALGVVVAAVVVTALIGCQGDDGEAIERAASPDQTVEVVMIDLAFTPAEIAVDADRQVRLIFRNNGAIGHDFTIGEMPHGNMGMMGGASGGDHVHGATANAIHIAVDPGTTATLDLETTEAGTFEFFCSVPGHREAGMAGSFVVR